MEAAMHNRIPERIVVGTDFSEVSDEALRVAANLAHAWNASLAIVHVYDAPHPYPVPLDETLRADLRAKLEAQCDVARAHVREVTAHLREGAPWTQIIALAVETGAAMIVLGTHGRRGASRFFVGSVAERTVRLSPVPVLTVPTARASGTQGGRE
jgi:nucleotide-binding universal stress UspA family protein